MSTPMPPSSSVNDKPTTNELLVKALEMNWTHARHIEDQRKRLATTYMAAMLGAGIVVGFSQTNPYVRVMAYLIGIVVTLTCWLMTHKYNLAFANQIQKADRCARRLLIPIDLLNPVNGVILPDSNVTKYIILSDSTVTEILHSYIGFPIKADPPLAWLNIRFMFDFLYGAILTIWVSTGILIKWETPIINFISLITHKACDVVNMLYPYLSC